MTEEPAYRIAALLLLGDHPRWCMVVGLLALGSVAGRLRAEMPLARSLRRMMILVAAFAGVICLPEIGEVLHWMSPAGWELPMIGIAIGCLGPTVVALLGLSVDNVVAAALSLRSQRRRATPPTA